MARVQAHEFRLRIWGGWAGCAGRLAGAVVLTLCGAAAEGLAGRPAAPPDAAQAATAPAEAPSPADERLPPGVWDGQTAARMEEALDAFFAASTVAGREEIFRRRLEPAGVGLSLDELITMAGGAHPKGKRLTSGAWPIRCPWQPRNSRGWFLLTLPDRYTPRKAWPLAVALHGSGQDGRNLVSFYTPRLNGLGYVVVYPTTARVENSWGSKGEWESIVRILQWVARRYRIDFRRLAVTGASMGGAGSWSYALEHPEIWNTAGVVAGFPVWRDGRVLRRLRGIRLMVMHGTEDRNIPVQFSRRVVAQLKQQGLSPWYVEVAGAGHTPPHKYWSAMCSWMARQPPKAWSPRPLLLPPVQKAPTSMPAADK